jgi:hypothetical protein
MRTRAHRVTAELNCVTAGVQLYVSMFLLLQITCLLLGPAAGHVHTYYRTCDVRQERCTQDGSGVAHFIVGTAGHKLSDITDEQVGGGRTGRGSWSCLNIMAMEVALSAYLQNGLYMECAFGHLTHGISMPATKGYYVLNFCPA